MSRSQICKFGLKGNMADEDFMIHVPNNLHDEYDVILDVENCLTLSGSDVPTIEVICKKSNHQYEKNKEKKKEESNTHYVEISINFLPMWDMWSQIN